MEIFGTKRVVGLMEVNKSVAAKVMATVMSDSQQTDTIRIMCSVTVMIECETTTQSCMFTLHTKVS